MKILPLLAALLCAAPLTFGRYGDPGDRHVVQDALECALERWRAATCLPLDVSLDAAHLVRLAAPDELGDLEGHTGGGSWDHTRIRLKRGMSDWAMCQVLTHELSHVLRRSNSHPGNYPSISAAGTSISQSRITHKDVDYVCSKQACACDNPEPATEPDDVPE